MTLVIQLTHTQIPVVVGFQLSLIPLLIRVGHGYIRRLLLIAGRLPHLTHLQAKQQKSAEMAKPCLLI